MPVWEMGRRNKMRLEVGKMLEGIKKESNLPTTAAMYAALTLASEWDGDLRSIVEDEFGQAPKRPRMWWQGR